MSYLSCALTIFSRVFIELEDLCLRTPWAGPIRKSATRAAWKTFWVNRKWDSLVFQWIPSGGVWFEGCLKSHLACNIFSIDLWWDLWFSQLICWRLVIVFLRRTNDNSDKSPKRDYHSRLLNGPSALILIPLPSVSNTVAQVIMSLFSKPKL